MSTDVELEILKAVREHTAESSESERSEPNMLSMVWTLANMEGVF